MNALQGARAVGAKYVVAVDPIESKRDSAKIFGATHTASSAEEAMPLVKDITAGLMADRVIVSPGVVHVDLLPLAMTLLRKGGICVLTGITPFTEPPVPLVLQEMTLSAKQLRGALYGGMNPRTSVPMLLSLYQAGALKLDELVTRHYQLDQINEAFADLREGRNIRGIIDFAGL
jgi:S-(hydroxymethyl)glutathione dehydrogenase/alcohol dehydrogenase